jgi:hypothetical protein
MLPEVATLIAALDSEIEEIEQAWDALQRAAENKETFSHPESASLVAFIATYVRKYEEEAVEVLKLLPASIEEIDEYARRRGWCKDYRDLRQEWMKRQRRRIQVRRDGGPWVDMRAETIAISVGYDPYAIWDAVTRLFDNGASFISMDIGVNNLKFQIVED